MWSFLSKPLYISMQPVSVFSSRLRNIYIYIVSFTFPYRLFTSPYIYIYTYTHTYIYMALRARCNLRCGVRRTRTLRAWMLQNIALQWSGRSSRTLPVMLPSEQRSGARNFEPPIGWLTWMQMMRCLQTFPWSKSSSTWSMKLLVSTMGPWAEPPFLSCLALQLLWGHCVHVEKCFGNNPSSRQRPIWAACVRQKVSFLHLLSHMLAKGYCTCGGKL